MSLDPTPSDAELIRMAAERSRRASFGRPFPLVAVPAVTEGTASLTIHATFDASTFTLPVRLRIPWSALVSDNAKYGVVNGKLIAQKPYRAAKKAIARLAIDAMQGRPAAACPLSLSARVYVPDNRVHDVVNFSKCVHDALKGSVFTDDQWLHQVTWIRAGVDVDSPRAEITISPL